MLKSAAWRSVARVESKEESAEAVPDAELVAVAQQDPQAFGPLYDRYLDLVYHYCYRRLGNREAAEDATSQTFAKALAALPRYRDRSFRSWLFAIAHNILADGFRASHHNQPLERTLMDITDEAPTPEERAVAADADRMVAELLARLPPGQRDVVELRLSGLTGPEIARALGRSHGSVKIAQFRAFARLRDLVSARSTTGPEENHNVCP